MSRIAPGEKDRRGSARPRNPSTRPGEARSTRGRPDIIILMSIIIIIIVINIIIIMISIIIIIIIIIIMIMHYELSCVALWCSV